MEKICVVGAGHVGLVAAAGFADLKHQVVCVDNNREKVAALKKLNIPFYEPGLEALVKKNFKSKRLTFSDNLDEAILQSTVIFIAVGTPPLPDGSADLSAVENVARTVARNLNAYKLVIEKSTVPVQTGKKIKEAITRYKKNNIPCDVASNPEFLREGKAVYDFFYPDRIVVGVESKRAEKIVRGIYAKLKAEIIITDINTAEIIKHASNSFLAAKISFINAISRICDLAGADVLKVAEAMGKDKRIGPQFLNAGIGWGGFCFPKDVEAFIHIAGQLGYKFGFLEEVKKINEDQRHYFVARIKERLWVLKGKKIAVLGLTFKPDTDDMRFAPSIDIVEALIAEGAQVSVYDPQAAEAKEIFKERVIFAENALDAVAASDCVCFLTEWPEFKEINLKKMKKAMRHALVADGRNMFDKKKMIKVGFDYIGIGR